MSSPRRHRSRHHTRSSGLVITRDRAVSSSHEIERSRHHTSPRRHRSRHHMRSSGLVITRVREDTDLVITRDRAVSSSHEPNKTNLVEARIRENHHGNLFSLTR
ncbi:unnamed protein product [Microthlaspi erraticum]|uniref:Uncharacterized protein n=1 Tax=Microthlaspi erraticum TaxID=1685480 RepID=A0A6D2L2N3_9BRAS|nr:unnamed protein product [Microthlaspi erraticum]